MKTEFCVPLERILAGYAPACLSYTTTPTFQLLKLPLFKSIDGRQCKAVMSSLQACPKIASTFGLVLI